MHAAVAVKHTFGEVPSLNIPIQIQISLDVSQIQQESYFHGGRRQTNKHTHGSSCGGVGTRWNGILADAPWGLVEKEGRASVVVLACRGTVSTRVIWRVWTLSGESEYVFFWEHEWNNFLGPGKCSMTPKALENKQNLSQGWSDPLKPSWRGTTERSAHLTLTTSWLTSHKIPRSLLRPFCSVPSNWKRGFSGNMMKVRQMTTMPQTWYRESFSVQSKQVWWVTQLNFRWGPSWVTSQSVMRY